MAKLYFYYAAMNAGKSTTLLQASYNYKERGMETLLFIPSLDNRHRQGEIHSRIGLKAKAHMFSESDNIYQQIDKLLTDNPSKPVKCVFVDEAQFLTFDQVLQLTDVADSLNIPVLTYGLRSDFKG